jgi:hypothetical protein
MTSHGHHCPCNQKLKNQISTFYPELKNITKLNDLERKKYLKNSSPCLLKFLSHCTGAILRKDIELPPADYEKLKPFKDLLLKFQNQKISLKKKKEEFFQKNKKGGFFALLPILASILGPILGKVISEHI